MAANHRAIEEQDRYVEAVAAAQLRVAVHIPDLQCRQCQRAPEPLERGEHLLAQLAASALHERKGHARPRQCRCCTGSVGSCAMACTWVAISRTVSGGTSPTAVTL